jgi:hypothetical protein
MRFAGAAVAMVLAVFGPVGCNDDDSSGSSELDGYFESHPFLVEPRSSSMGNGVVQISPSSASVNQVGGKALFKATGGEGVYTWDVLDSSIGSVDGSGSQGSYTALKVGNNDVIVYDSAGNWARAPIAGTASALSISADPTTLTPDVTFAVLKASGGQPPYTWSKSAGTGAIVGSDTGASVVYRRDDPGDNVLTVTDSLGDRASVIITQP